MSDETTRLLRSAPYFPVRDVAQAVAYYQSLGFAPDYVAGSLPEFAIVARDGLSIMFRRVVDTDIWPNERQGGTWDVFFWVEGLEALFGEMAGAGVEVVYGPVVQDAYGMAEFAIRDAFGYVLGFGEPVSTTT